MKMKSIVLLRYIASLLLILFSSNSYADVTLRTFKIPSKFENWEIEVFGFFPDMTSTVKGIIFVIPGTSGFVEPKILRRNTENILNVEQPSELASAFLEAGYIYLTTNYRGMKSGYQCLREKQVKPIEFIDECIDIEVRKTIDFEKIESDIELALERIQTSDELKSYPLIVAAISEGGVHISRLVQQKKIDPKGIIGIGVPTTSMLDNIKDQLSLNVQLRIVLNSLKKNKVKEFCPADIKKTLPYIRNEIDQILRNNLFQVCRRKSEISMYMRKAYDLANEQLRVMVSNPTPFGGNVFDVAVDEFVGFKWLLDALNDQDDLASKLAHYEGGLILIYGEYDSTIAISPDRVCKSKKQVKQQCIVKVMKGVDHTLQNQSSRIAKDVLVELVKYANSIVDVNAKK